MNTDKVQELIQSGITNSKVEVVDTTGAWDAFHAGFIYGLLQEWSLERIVQFASAVAALNCMYLGGRTGLPDLPTVKLFLSQRNS